MNTIEYTVYRKYLHDTYTIGRFMLDQKVICDTLEDVVRDLKDINHDNDFTDSGEGKIYGETAIPCGRYQVVVSYSPKLKRRLPLLLKVSGFEGIRIHSLVSARGTEGCIGVGQNKERGKLTNGPYFENLIIQMMDEAINEGHKIYLTVKQ